MSGSIGDNVFRASGVIAAAAAGRTGTVDWDTTIKVTGDSPITAENANGYFLNTTAGTITINLPTSPSAGAIVSLKDYARNWGTNNVTVGRGGSNMDGSASDATLDTNGLSVTFIYMDATKGWSLINDDTTTNLGATFLVASGGTPCAGATCGDYKVHTFTGPGNLVVASVGNAAGSNAVDYITIAGGGGGGGNGGGAGGAGGYREGTTTYTPVPSAAATSQIPVTASTYPITVGAGGTAGSHPVGPGGLGANSIFSTITSTGGGGGGSNGPGTPPYPGNDGGSGGGKAQTGTAGSGNTPPVSPSQGNAGGGGGGAGMCTGSGGGGIGGVGGDSPSLPGSGGGAQLGGPSGAGMDSDITGSTVARGGGGSGGFCYGSATPKASPVGTGGGGAGNSHEGANGSDNTGGGAGGGGAYSPGAGGAGGSGVVIIRYKFQ